MTVSRVAKIAGVSTATVSRVINRDPRISDATTERIKEIIAEIGYTPKPPTLRKGRRTLAQRGIRFSNVALVEIGNHFTNSPLIYQIERSVAANLAQHGINMVLVYIENDLIPPCLNRHQVDGVIVLAGKPSRKVAALIKEFPSLWISSRHDFSGDYVVGGHDTGGRLAAQYLLKKEHHLLAYINPWPDHPAHRTRGEGFQFAALKAGVSVEIIQPKSSEWQLNEDPDILDFAKIEECMSPLVDRLLAMSPRPTGLFVSTDMFAAIVYRLFHKRHVKPGRDIEVISANNEGPYLAGLYPRPTTIDIGGERMGRYAVDQLLLCIQRPEETRGLRMIVEPVIIEGDPIE